MADAPPPPPKAGAGRKFGKGAVVPEHLRPKPKEEEDIRPSGLTTGGISSMLGRPAAKKFGAGAAAGAKAPAPVAAAKVAGDLSAAEAAAAAEAAKALSRVPRPRREPAAAAALPPAEGEAAAAAALPPAEGEAGAGELLDLLEEHEGAAAAPAVGADGLPDPKALGRLIRKEETKDLYNTSVPEAYVPQTRRGFSDFINVLYSPFKLPEGPIVNPPGEQYFPYQKFVRDYMRQAAPYRGILVYHGLGSGKTCTSIAAAEALFSNSKKKIVVMTPFSLRKNFLREVSFCGFRHFQMATNYWIPYPKNPTTILVAEQALGIPASHLRSAQKIWIPDFTKPPSESNYASLEPTQRGEIRKQILSSLEWDPVKNPGGRIHFLNYNGVSTAKLLQLACDPAVKKFFDDAVIVVDEVHNLVRLMQGSIEPFVRQREEFSKLQKTIPVEPIQPERWRPTICPKEGEVGFTKLYTRGYLFYRLLIDATNSKFVGLSGTPLINFPEELGILANILHGYIPVLKGNINQSGRAVEDAAMTVGHKNPYVDFVEARQAGGVTAGAEGAAAAPGESKSGTNIILSLMPYGTRKLDNDRGVLRIPPEEVPPTIDEIVASIEADFAKAGIPINGKLVRSAEPVLPPFGRDFQSYFVNTEDVVTFDEETGEVIKKPVIKNKGVILTRLTGLISYYKGSQLELMPRIKVDEVVRVPFSSYSQAGYMRKRGVEIKKEIESAGKGTIDDAMKVAGMLSDKAGSSNYKMGSRQACNFTFPPEVTRPVAATARELREEAAGGKAKADLVYLGEDTRDLARAPEVEAAQRELEEEMAGGDEDDEEGAAREDDEAETLLRGGPVAAAAAAPAEEREEGPGGAAAGGEEEEAGGAAAAAAAAFTGSSAAEGGPGVAPEAEEEAPAAGNGGTVAVPTGLTLFGGGDDDIVFGVMIDNEYKPFLTVAAVSFTLDGNEYKTAEHYYQSQKYVKKDPAYAEKIRAAPTAKSARLLGSLADKIPMIAPNFEKKKLELMMKALSAKFEQNPELRALLLGTETKEIVYRSEADAYWGKSEAGVGENHLGVLLVQLREAIRLNPAGKAKKGKKAAAAAEDAGGAEGGVAAAATRVAAAAARAAPAGTLASAAAAVGAVAGQAPGAALSPADQCKAGRLKGQTYKDACRVARECLSTLAAPRMKLDSPEGLPMIAPKFAEMLKRINALPGSSLVYSQFLDMEGIGLFRIAMEQNGYKPIRIIGKAAGVDKGSYITFDEETLASLAEGPGKPRYMVFTGGEDENIRRVSLDLFNARFSDLPTSLAKTMAKYGYTDNKQGQLCRVFCITSAGAEGLSLRNVRGVHIMEPYWNDVRLRQVKGRAVRINSHIDLPEEDRDVSVYTYLSVFPDEAILGTNDAYRVDNSILMKDSVTIQKALEYGIPVKPGMTRYILSTDEMIYAVAQRKKRIVDELELIMKAAAVDCELNYEQNKTDGYQCIPLKGKVGDFIYHPVLERDIEGARRFEGLDSQLVPKEPGAAPAAEAPARAPAQPPPAAKLYGADSYQKIAGKLYRLREILDQGTKKVKGYLLYKVNEERFAAGDRDYKLTEAELEGTFPQPEDPSQRLGLVGRVSAREPSPGRFVPAKPLVFFEAPITLADL
jgi:ribA/ribD-fused uncharacterized protein